MCNSKLLQGILKCIPDIIKVYNSDYTVEFYNDAGYKFHNKTYEEVKGKKCYNILERQGKCKNCNFEEAMKTKKMVQAERYMPEFNKYVHLSFNPVLDDNNEVVFMVERLSDITQKRIVNNIIKENKEKLGQIFDNSHYASLVIIDYKIVLVNNKLCKLMKEDYKEIIGKSIFEYFPKDYIKIAYKRMKYMLLNKKTESSHDYKLISNDNRKIDVEITSSYFMYKDQPAIRLAIRDITEMKKGLYRAAKIQSNTLQKYFPIPEKVNMESVYFPSKTVSGDFFRMYKVNDNLVIGAIVDVSGKGITAALSVSAFDVLFHEVVLVLFQDIVLSTNNLKEVANMLNKKVAEYLGEKYIAACFFIMDFIENKINVIGSGINEFIFKPKGKTVEQMVVKGSFLGMFQDSIFEEKVICFQPGDKIYFFTDGLDFILDDDKIIQRYMKKVSITQFGNFVEDYLNDKMTEIDGLQDDCTLLALEIR